MGRGLGGHPCPLGFPGETCSHGPGWSLKEKDRVRRELWRLLAPTEAVTGWEQKQLPPKPPPLEEGAQLQGHFER